MLSITSANSLKSTLLEVDRKNAARNCWDALWGTKYVVVKTADGKFDAVKKCWFYYANNATLATKEDLRPICNRTLIRANDITSNERGKIVSALTSMKCEDIAREFLSSFKTQGNSSDSDEYIEPPISPPPQQPQQTNDSLLSRLPRTFDQAREELKAKEIARLRQQDPLYGVDLSSLPPVEMLTTKVVEEPSLRQEQQGPACNFPQSIMGELDQATLHAQQKSVPRSSSGYTTVSSSDNGSNRSSPESVPQGIERIEGQSAYRTRLAEQFGQHILDDVEISTTSLRLTYSDFTDADRGAIRKFIQDSYLVDPKQPQKGYKGGSVYPPTVYFQPDKISIMISGLLDGTVTPELKVTYDTMFQILKKKQVKACAHLYTSPIFLQKVTAHA